MLNLKYRFGVINFVNFRMIFCQNNNLLTNLFIFEDIKIFDQIYIAAKIWLKSYETNLCLWGKFSNTTYLLSKPPILMWNYFSLFPSSFHWSHCSSVHMSARLKIKIIIALFDNRLLFWNNCKKTHPVRNQEWILLLCSPILRCHTLMCKQLQVQACL